MVPLLERWVPMLIASFLFFQVVRLLLGLILQRLVTPKVVLIVSLLIVMGFLPLSVVRAVLVGSVVFLFDVIQTAYHIVFSGASTA